MDAPASSADAPPIPAQLPPSAPPVGGAEAGAGNGGGSQAASGEVHACMDAVDGQGSSSEVGRTTETGIQGGSEHNSEEEEHDSPLPVHSSSSPVAGDLEVIIDQGPPRERTPSVTAAVSSLLSFDEAVDYTNSGIIPSSSPGSQTVCNILPGRHVLPPKRSNDGNSYLVGVPAHPLAYRSDCYVQEGYGGTEALAIFDGLSAQDIHDLGNLVGSQTELRNNLLRPRVDQGSLRLVELETTLSSLLWRRESASVLSQFPVERFAERLFYTTSLLHRVLDRARHGDFPIRGAAEASPNGGVSLQQRYNTLAEEHRFLQMYHQREVTSLRAENAALQTRLEHDFAMAARTYLDEEEALRTKVAETEAKLERAVCAVERLRASNRENAFDATRLMQFLNQGGAATRGRWPRLVRLLRHFQRGSTPPAHWVTNITVEAADRPFRMIPPYPGPVDSDMEDDDDNVQAEDDGGNPVGDQERKSEDNPLTCSRAGFSSADTPPPRSKRQRPEESRSGSCPRGLAELSSKNGPVYVQLRPSVHPGSDVLPLSPQTDFTRLIPDCAKSLPEFVSWSDVRLDVQFLMRMSRGYEEALDILRQDQPAHQYFPKPWLLEMLVKMMYHGTLDDTPWTRHVPETFYKLAEVILQQRLRQGLYPEKFPPLRNLAEDAAAVLELVPDGDSSENSHSSDSDYEDKPKRSSSRKSVSGSSKAESIEGSSSASSSEEDAIKPKRNSKRNRVSLSSDSSSGGDSRAVSSKRGSSRSKFALRDKFKSTPSKKQPKKRSRTSRSQREGGQSPLASKQYEDLSVEELAIIETPSGDIISWRRRGIGTRFAPKKGGLEGQTPGFPNYAPHQPETKFLARRWPAVEDEYAALMESEPWLEMFANRVKVMYFHRRDQLSPSVIRMLDQHVEYMQDHLPAFWHILHWFMMKVKPEDDEKRGDLAVYERAQDLHRRRQTLHDGVARTFEARIKRMIKAGMPETMVWEPGFWLYPCKICYLYLVDESTKKDDGTRYTLADQIAMAEREDPGRTQWASCTDAERLAHVPTEIVDTMLLSERERVGNWVSAKFQ